jgi:uncharacterized membrane protein (DUF4010 family)
MDLKLLQSLGTALFIGALVGIERLQHQQSEAPGIAGIRTFMLFSTFGALCGWLSRGQPSLVPFVVGLGCVAALVTTAYVVQRRVREDSAGTTTEVAALVVYVLGGITLLGHAGLAVALGIMTAALLALKKPLHEAVGRIRREELLATLRLLFASFIVLPLLPNRTIDPWGALNPYKLWWLVILISALSMIGYVAVRFWGAARGTVITGFFGGLVSSTAATLTFARQSHDDASNQNAFGAGTLLAWTVMILRVIVLTALLGWPLMTYLWWPLVALGVFNATLAYIYTRRASAEVTSPTLPQPVVIRNPFRLLSAMKFAVVFGLVLLASKLAQKYAPAIGLYSVSTLAGATDADAVVLSIVELTQRNIGDHRVLARCILLGVCANTLVKFALAAFLGNPRLARILLPATAGLAAGCVGTVMFI